jgi:hypothetical protein
MAANERKIFRIQFKNNGKMKISQQMVGSTIWSKNVSELTPIRFNCENVHAG